MDADQQDTAEFEVTRDGSSQLFEVAEFDGNTVQLVRTNDADLTAGDYTVTVTGLGEEELTAETTVEEQEAGSLDINAEHLTDENPKAKVGISLADQYGDELELQESDFTVTAYNETQNQDVTVDFDSADDYFYVDTSETEEFEVDDEITVTFLHEESGLKDTKTLTVVEGSQLDSISLGEAQLPEDTNLLTEDLEDIAVPYTAKDQYGNDVELSEENVEIISSNENIVSEDAISFDTVDDEPVLNVSEFGGTGDVTITLLNKVNGETATVTLEVNEQAGTPYAVSVDRTSVEVASNGQETLDLTVTDKYGNEVDAADYVDENFTVVSSNKDIVTAEIDDTEGNETYGEVVVTPTEGANQGQEATVTVTLNSTGDSVTTDVTLGEAATPFNVEVAEDSDHSNSLVVGGTTTVDFSVFDQYENDATDGENYEVQYSFKEDDASDYLTLSDSADDDGAVNSDDISDASVNVTADAAGSATVVAQLVDTEGEEVLDEVEVPFTTVANSSEEFDYEVADIPELYKNGSDSGDGYLEEVTVNAVDEDGSELEVPNSDIVNVTASNNYVEIIEPTNTDNQWYVVGNSEEPHDDDKTATLTLNVSTDEGTQTIEKDVVVSGEASQTQELALMEEGADSENAEAVESVSVSDYEGNITFNTGDNGYIWATDQFGVTENLDLAVGDDGVTSTVTVSGSAYDGIENTSDDEYSVDTADVINVVDDDNNTAVEADSSYRLTVIHEGVALDIPVQVENESLLTSVNNTDDSADMQTVLEENNLPGEDYNALPDSRKTSVGDTVIDQRDKNYGGSFANEDELGSAFETAVEYHTGIQSFSDAINTDSQLTVQEAQDMLDIYSNTLGYDENANHIEDYITILTAFTENEDSTNNTLSTALVDKLDSDNDSSVDAEGDYNSYSRGDIFQALAEVLAENGQIITNDDLLTIEVSAEQQ